MQGITERCFYLTFTPVYCAITLFYSVLVTLMVSAVYSISELRQVKIACSRWHGKMHTGIWT